VSVTLKSMAPLQYKTVAPQRQQPFVHEVRLWSSAADVDAKCWLNINAKKTSLIFSRRRSKSRNFGSIGKSHAWGGGGFFETSTVETLPPCCSRAQRCPQRMRIKLQIISSHRVS
jgi:hypothetical protein